MGDVQNRGSLFPEELIPDLITLVRGKSALAALTPERPVAFNGNKEFTFNMDKEIDIIGESAQKSTGGITVLPVTTIPYKMEYGARVSDEFLYGAEEYQIDVLKAFSDGFAMKVARGLDIGAIHGLNPRTQAASTVVSSNCFKSKVTQTVTLTSSPENDIETAIALIEAMDGDISGAAFSTSFRSALSQLRDDIGRRVYPDLAWGQAVGAINGLPVTANSTLSFAGESLSALVGDFASSVRWGYAKEIPLEIIPYGNPDNSTEGDLKNRNQVYVRAEIYVGWGILIPSNFVRIVAAA